MKNMRLWFYIIVAVSTLFVGCWRGPETGPTGSAPSALGEVPAVRLNSRYEADVPRPPETQTNPTREERNPAIQADFDQNRPQEILDRTIEREPIKLSASGGGREQVGVPVGRLADHDDECVFADRDLVGERGYGTAG